ncbi:hypothetical protein [Glycomyces sp. NRRL B-16210]|uniref:hypothetical protein n=1 Tax=Glycomyces sp. NRRL B-16210 TaxID=1463821 RepID=UPI00068AD1DF|nr:hypothetical protein [Glycomyces sp. NRRL B-16210]
MPDSIRELLQGIAGDEPGPSADLAAGAFKRARTIGRRRMAAAVVGAVTALALASVGAAALIDPDAAPEPAPAVTSATDASPTDVSSPSEPVETTAESSAPETDSTDHGCGSLDGWDGWGASEASAPLQSLPEVLYFEVRDDGMDSPSIVRFDDDGHEYVLDGNDGYALAPNGDRYATSAGGECAMFLATLGGTGAEVPELGTFGPRCEPYWSPDSNRVVLNAPADDEGEGGFLLDVTTGESFALPAEVGCSPRWSADGEYLVSADLSVAMRPDGSGRVALGGVWTDAEDFTGLSAISADLGRACLQMDESPVPPDPADANRCDLYVDLRTGVELELPVATQSAQVVFLEDGSMIVTDDQYGTVVVSLVGEDGTVLDERTLPGLSSGGTYLRGYHTG